MERLRVRKIFCPPSFAITPRYSSFCPSIFLPKHLFARWFSSALLAPASPRETEGLVKVVGTFHAWNVLLPAAQYFGLLSALVIETDAQILIQAS